MRSLWIGASGLGAGQLKADVHGHNIANINTPGFKARNVNFSEAMHRETVRPRRITDQLPGAEEPVAIGGGTNAIGISLSQRNGPLQLTGQTWHLALPDEGFFPVGMPGAPGGQAFTRNGAFQQDRTGTVVDAKGRPLLNTSGNPIRVPEDVTDITVQPDGTITAYRATDDEEEPVETITIGRLRVARFTNPQGLEHLGDGLYGATEASGQPRWIQPGSEGVVLRQGALEGANVDLATEMVGLISAQRTLQFAARVVQTSDEMLGIANRLYK